MGQLILTLLNYSIDRVLLFQAIAVYPYMSNFKFFSNVIFNLITGAEILRMEFVLIGTTLKWSVKLQHLIHK